MSSLTTAPRRGGSGRGAGRGELIAALVQRLTLYGEALMDVQSLDRAEPFTTKDGSTIRELQHTAEQSLAEATLAPGSATERHYHALSEEIYFFLEGGGSIEIDGEMRAVGPGDAVLIPAGARHTMVGGELGARFLCCCAPPYSHEDTYFE